MKSYSPELPHIFCSLFHECALEGGSRENALEARVVQEGRADGEIVIKVENVGDASADGSGEAVAVRDVLPAGFEAVGVSGEKKGDGNGFTAMSCRLTELVCEYGGAVTPFSELEIRVLVRADVGAGATSGAVNRVVVLGGGTPGVSVSHGIFFSGGGPVPFGLEDYELLNEEEGGAVVTQAGAHPFQQTTVVDFIRGLIRTRRGKRPKRCRRVWRRICRLIRGWVDRERDGCAGVPDQGVRHEIFVWE